MMNDRDHFAAAALTGLLSASDANSWADDLWADDLCRTAFGWADAMLRERASTNFAEISSTLTNHDAAPAARAAPESVGTDKAEPLQGLGTGDTPADTGTTQPRNGAVEEPDAWLGRAARTDGGSVVCLCRTDEELGREMYSAGTCEPREFVPLYRHPQPALTDAEREAIASCVADDDAATAYKRADILRGLLERLK